MNTDPQPFNFLRQVLSCSFLCLVTGLFGVGCTQDSSGGSAGITHDVDPDKDTVIATDYAKVVVKRKTFDKKVSLQVRDLKDFKTLFPDLGKATPLGFGVVIEAKGNDSSPSAGLSVTLSVPGAIRDIDQSKVYVLGIIEVEGVELRFSIAPDQLFITDLDPTDGEFNIVFTTPEVSAGVYVAVLSESGPPAGYPDSREINFDPHAKVAEIKLVGPTPFTSGECSEAFWLSLLDSTQSPLVANRKMVFKVSGVQNGNIFQDDRCKEPFPDHEIPFAKGQKKRAFYFKGDVDLRTLQLSAEVQVDDKAVRDTWQSILSGRSDAAFVAGHFVYDQSSWDGKIKGPNHLDQKAIPTEKNAFRYQKKQASEKHISSYVHGINGLAIDIAQLNYPLSAADLEFRIGARRSDQTTAIDPGTWSLAPSPTSISIAWGQGENHSDRVYIFWANGVIRNQWLLVKILANAQTGLSQDEMLYFGHLTGDANGDGTVNAEDLGVISNTGSQNSDVDLKADFDRDGYVDANDQQIYQEAVGTEEIHVLNSVNPFVRSIRIASSGWAESFILAQDPDNGEGMYIALDFLMWPIVYPNLDRLTVRFSEPMVMPSAGFSLIGSQVINYGNRFTNAQLDESGEIYTVDLTAPIATDKLKILFHGWTDELGNTLKENHESEGYQVRFDVLPGDGNRDGQVFTTDLAVWQTCFGSFAGDAGYDIKGDWNGDGACNNTDLEIWQTFFNHSLSYVGEP